MRRLVSLALLTLVVLASGCVSQQKFAKMMDEYVESKEGRKVLATAVQTHFTEARKNKGGASAKDRFARLETQFNNPADIKAGKGPSKGPKDAPVTIIEFSDFQCPFCKRGADTMDALLAAYPGQVRLVFKHLPLQFHQQALPAAKASLAAERQGKFWEMHDSFFVNQSKLSEEFFLAEAQRLGLDVAKFKHDMASKEIAEQVEADLALAKKYGARGTPNFFVNGVRVAGAQPLDLFKKVVDKWLEMKGK